MHAQILELVLRGFEFLEGCPVEVFASVFVPLGDLGIFGLNFTLKQVNGADSHHLAVFQHARGRGGPGPLLDHIALGAVRELLHFLSVLKLLVQLLPLASVFFNHEALLIVPG